TISALSNEPYLGGGYILLGAVKNELLVDPRYSIVGVSDPDKLLNEIVSLCRDSFNIPVRPEIKVISYQSRTSILLVHVPEANPHDKPVYIKSKGLEKGAYRRIGSTDQMCTRDDIHLLYQFRARRKYDETLVDRCSLEDFDPKAIQAYREERKLVKPDAAE